MADSNRLDERPYKSPIANESPWVRIIKKDGKLVDQIVTMRDEVKNGRTEAR